MKGRDRFTSNEFVQDRPKLKSVSQCGGKWHLKETRTVENIIRKLSLVTKLVSKGLNECEFNSSRQAKV